MDSFISPLRSPGNKAKHFRAKPRKSDPCGPVFLCSESYEEPYCPAQLDRTASFQSRKPACQLNEYDVKKLLRREILTKVVMPDIDTFDQEKHVLGNIGRVVRNPFKIMGDKN